MLKHQHCNTVKAAPTFQHTLIVLGCAEQPKWPILEFVAKIDIAVLSSPRAQRRCFVALPPLTTADRSSMLAVLLNAECVKW